MLKPRISSEWLFNEVEKTSRGSKGGNREEELRLTGAAQILFKMWLGPKWFRKRIHKHPFLNPEPLGLSTDPFMRQGVITELAEHMFNMQHVDGIEHVVERIANGQRIADDVAELAGASLLQRAGINFRFVKTTGKKGADYDVDATIGGQRVCFEMKGKVASPSIQTVVKTLEKAGDQVPANTSNVIVVQARDDWMITREGFEALEEGIKEYFRKWGHFSRIIVHAAEWRTLREEGVEELGAVFWRRPLVYPHPNPAVPFPPAAPVSWLAETGRSLRLHDIVASPSRREYLRRAEMSYIQQLKQEQSRRSAVERGQGEEPPTVTP